MRSLATFTAAAAVLGLAACSVERTADMPSAPSAPLAAAGAAGSGCDFSRMKSDARDYFATSKDEIVAILGDLQSLYRAGPTSSATLNKGFDGLDRIARARTTAGALKSAATATQGATVASDLFACMPITAPSTTDLASALDVGGLFAVRGGSGDARTDGIYSYDTSANAPPAWGAEPSSGSWGTASGGTRFLAYGWPITPKVNDALYTTKGFELNSAPAHLTFDPKLVVGTCIASTGAARIQHESEVLPLQSLSCAPITTASAEPGTGVRAMLRVVTGLFVPKPAYAKMYFASGMGGLSGSWSPFAAIDAKNVVVTFVGQPRDGYVNTRISGTDHDSVSVTVTTAGGTALVGAGVDLTVIGNSGSFTASGTHAVTDKTGRAVFGAFKLDKAGGYTISAAASFDGITGPAATGTPFNIKNKAAP
jgi:hypothetical protein